MWTPSSLVVRRVHKKWREKVENQYFLVANALGASKSTFYTLTHFSRRLENLLKLVIYLLIWEKRCNAFLWLTDKIQALKYFLNK